MAEKKGKKVELKTKKNKKSVVEFINSVPNEVRRRDAKTVLKIMKDVTGEKPVMWGSSIIGFGDYSYTYPTGRSANWMMLGFSPRQKNTTIYIMPGYQYPQYKALLKELGPHTLGKACLYIKDFDDIHLPTLKKIIKKGYTNMKKKYKK